MDEEEDDDEFNTRGYALEFNRYNYWANFGETGISDGRHIIDIIKEGDLYVVVVYGKNLQPVTSKGGTYPTEREAYLKLMKLSIRFDSERTEKTDASGIERNIRTLFGDPKKRKPRLYSIEHETKQFKRLMKKI